VVTEESGHNNLTGSTSEEVPQTREDSPMKSYVGLDVHSKSSVFEALASARVEPLHGLERPTREEKRNCREAACERAEDEKGA
jgi:hypothetical protein